MWYWILMFLLIAGSLALLAVTFIGIKKNNGTDTREMRRRRREPDEEDDDEEERTAKGRRQRVQHVEQERSRSQKKRRWKIILEDIDSWEKYSFIFFDTVGIGRGKDGSMYEKYLPVGRDGRVSKRHCVIVGRGDKLYLKDEGSRNGTFLNGNHVDKAIVIQKDDIIGVGNTRLEVQRILRESE